MSQFQRLQLGLRAHAEGSRGIVEDRVEGRKVRKEFRILALPCYCCSCLVLERSVLFLPMQWRAGSYGLWICKSASSEVRLTGCSYREYYSVLNLHIFYVYMSIILNLHNFTSFCPPLHMPCKRRYIFALPCFSTNKRIYDDDGFNVLNLALLLIRLLLKTMDNFFHCLSLSPSRKFWDWPKLGSQRA